MSAKGILITAQDLETGEVATRTIVPGDYCLVTAFPCKIDMVDIAGGGKVEIRMVGHGLTQEEGT